MNSIDEEGQELINDAAALAEGARHARIMAADSVLKGHLILDHRIEVQKDGGDTIGTVYFRDVVKIRETA